MSEYEELRGQLLDEFQYWANSSGKTPEKLIDGQLSIIAERCYFKCNPIGLPLGCIDYGLCEGCKYENNHGKPIEPIKQR